MKLIIGLGNPEEQHATTRHNAGFLCVDFLAKAFDFGSFVMDKKHSAAIARGSIDTETVLLIKPLTYMNHSGTAVQALLQFYKCSLSDILVIHDDLDIAPGTYKTTPSSRSAGHNGVQNIIDSLGAQDFSRIRIGIGRPTETHGVCMPSHEYVLEHFTVEEQAALDGLFPKIKEEVAHWLRRPPAT